MKIKFGKNHLSAKFIVNHQDVFIDVSLREESPLKFINGAELKTTLSLKDLNLSEQETELLIIIFDKIFEKVTE